MDSVFQLLDPDSASASSDFESCDVTRLLGVCRTLLRCNPICLALLTADGGVEFMNENGLAYLEIDHLASVVGQEWAGLWPIVEQAKARLAIDQARAGETVRFQSSCLSSTGVTRWWDVIVSPIANATAGQATLLAAARDITALREVEDRQAQSHRLEALGRLTGGVAHDFNNLLTVVMGASESLAGELGHNPESRDLALVSMRAAERGADLVRRLLAFARRQPLEPQTVDCTDLIGSLQPMVQHTLHEGIELSLSAPGDPILCSADRAELQSALLNLCINARDAMPDGGALSLKLETVTLTARPAEKLGLQAGQYAVFVIRDTGVGMSAENLEKAIEPFFTTKSAVGGSGLGLSTVYGFARQSGGQLAITSKLGEGTSVRLYLPRLAKGEAQADSLAPAPVDRKGHVLVVEDDEMVRLHVARTLSQLNYRVTAVSDGDEAVAILESDQAIDLLLTDVVMPGGMNGIEVAERGRVLRPDLKVLFTSGYTEDSVLPRGKVGGPSNFLAKPYRREQFSSAIATAMAKRRAGDFAPSLAAARAPMAG